jgi:hypothetical protein
MIPLLIAGAMAAGSAIANGVSSANAAKKLQEGEANARTDVQNYASQAAGYQQPYYDIGTQNAATLSQKQNNGDFNTPSYNYQDQEQQPGAYQQTAFNYAADPGYAFQKQQGLNSIQNSAAAGGGLLSGATMKAMQAYGTGVANQNYNDAYQRYISGNQLGLATNQNAYNQYTTNRQTGMTNAMNVYNTANQQNQQNYGRYSDLANMGVGASRNLSDIYNQAGMAVANTDIGQANAGAAGTMAVGNAVSNGLQNVGNAAGNYFYNQKPTAPTATGTFNNNYGNLDFSGYSPQGINRGVALSSVNQNNYSGGNGVQSIGSTELDNGQTYWPKQ